ncbi:uncharacterized protein GGS22DRAFT_63591 [Annulohypoxylon maeteangense]|uniref:uncharacterized protein n=1 Tax=Annulohypoxylon maeteangense TaxID=1927788 RepID=UPI002007C4CE|nr:uncharacterized protein GGS22DRAFT_63591 [Annulohypoxylon maeteangense]KAI0888837.1 hypothetical protein GGS22DRAFT_63591 [Annulohypoxylon maeteangense]
MMKMEARDTTRKSCAEFSINLDDTSSNGRVTTSACHYHAHPTRSASDAPYHFPNTPSEDAITQSRPLHTEVPILDGWQTFPPPPVPRLDLDKVKRASGKGLRDVEEFTDQHIQQSIALCEAMGLACTKAKEIEHERESHKDKEKDNDTKVSSQEDQVLFAEMRRMYYSFASLEGCENHASIRRHYSEFLKHQSQQPPRKPSKTERLLGSDGSSTNTDIPRNSQLYFLGSPPKMYIIPFDKAVAAGLEDVKGSNARVTSLPSVIKAEPSQSGLSLPAAPFLFQPSPSKPQNDNIPDWFPLLKIPVKGDDLQSRWTSFSNTFSALEKAMELKDDKPKWDKTWHEPNPKWQFEFRVKKGGWWKCRSGPDAPKVEAECRLCHGATEPSKKTASLEERYKEMMDAINEAMREVAEKDKAAALSMLRQQGQHDEASQYKSWVEEQRKIKQRSAEKTAYRRTKGYNLLRGYEEPSNQVPNGSQRELNKE